MQRRTSRPGSWTTRAAKGSTGRPPPSHVATGASPNINRAAARAGPRQGNSRSALCGRSQDRRPRLDRDCPGRTNGNAVSNPRISEFDHRRLQVPPSPLHDPFPTPSSQHGSQRAINRALPRLTRDIRVRWPHGEVPAKPINVCFLGRSRTDLLTVSSSTPDPGGVKTCKLENEENGLSPIDQNRRCLRILTIRIASRRETIRANQMVRRHIRTSSRASPRSWRCSTRSSGLPNKAPSMCGGASISAWSRSGQSRRRERLAMDTERGRAAVPRGDRVRDLVGRGRPLHRT